MLAIFSYFFGGQAVLILACAIASYQISKNKLAPTLMYRIMAIGFFVLLIRQAHTLSYANSITNFLESQDKAQVIFNQLTGCLGYALIITALGIKLTNVKHLSETKNDNIG